MKLPDDRLPERLYSAASVREMDRASIQDHNLPGYLLMTRAAEACVQALYQHWPQPARAAILCGGGNNGGDGYVLARLLIERGVAVEALWWIQGRSRGEPRRWWDTREDAPVAAPATT